MKSIDEAVKDIVEWNEDGCVGNLILFSAPRSQNVDIIAEQTIKLREMDRETRDAIHNVFDLLDSERIELFRDKDGYPDRAKVIRRL